MMELTPEEQQKQIAYRDARTTGQYDDIWQSVGKCVFCDLREKYVFFEENGVVMTISLFAYIDGQFMIIPRRHVRSTRELTQLEWETVRKFIYIAKKIIREVHGIKGMQVVQRDGGVIAQSTVEHLHIQCTPFDAPDLSVWNYRKLKYTPLENVEKYKQAGKKILKHGTKFDEKYAHPSALPIVCDALIINENDELLFEERSSDAKLVPDYITPPGGVVERFDIPLEAELAREVKEETGLTINPEQLVLLSSQAEDMKRLKKSPHLKLAYVQTNHILRNTYIYENVPANASLKAGDDSSALLWVPMKKVAKYDRISPEIKKSVELLISQRNHGR